MAQYPPAREPGASPPVPAEPVPAEPVPADRAGGEPGTQAEATQAAAGQAEAGQAGAGQAAAGQAEADLRWLRQAIELSRCSPRSDAAFSVGAVLVSGDGEVIATGYSRELDPKDHAEEVALARAAGDARLPGATLYSSLEPCRTRASRSRSCAELIAEAGVRRVVIAWLEPPVFTDGGGAAQLRQAGVTVAEIPWLAGLASAVNAHLLPG